MTSDRVIETGNILLASPKTDSDLSQKLLTKGLPLAQNKGVTLDKRAAAHSFFGAKHRFSGQEVSDTLKQLNNEQVTLSKQGFFAPCRVASNLSDSDQNSFQHFMIAAV